MPAVMVASLCQNGSMPDTKPIRCFLGVPVDATFTALLQPLCAALQMLPWAGSLRWVEPHNLHLTLAFLGDQPLELIPTLQRNLLVSLASLPAFRLTGDRLCGFPDAKSSILALEFHTCDALQQLKTLVDETLRQEGLVPDQRPLRPHITLARGSRGQQLPWQWQPCELRLPVGSVTLFQSVAGAAGSDYRALWSIAL